MAASHLARDPAPDPDGGAFLDALAGLDSVCRCLAIALGEAARPARPAPPTPDGGAGEAQGEPPDADDLVDALLGLVSVHRTVSLLLAAVSEIGGGAGEGSPAPEGPPAWSREVLR